MEAYSLQHADCTVYLALFRRVQNAQSLRQRLISASTLPESDDGDKERAAVDYAFIDASMITSRLHLLTAINQALLTPSLKSKTLHSEVIWMLEPGTNISEALKHFGLSANTKDLLLVRIRGNESAEKQTSADVEAGMKSIVEGELASLDLLGNLPEGGTNDKGLRKIYKLNGDAALASVKAGTQEYSTTLDQLVTSCTALKSVM
ncbi:hypothetical protein JCM5350_001222 [Sporobolomyces pararoseus]